jgi:hypothetical protein
MKRAITRLVFALSISMVSALALAEGHYGKTVQQLQPGHYANNCFFFTLDGVPVADPAAKPNDPWFAMDSTSSGAKQILATLLAARASGAPVSVWTTGGLVCGYAAVATLIM